MTGRVPLPVTTAVYDGDTEVRVFMFSSKGELPSWSVFLTVQDAHSIAANLADSAEDAERCSREWDVPLMGTPEAEAVASE